VLEGSNCPTTYAGMLIGSWDGDCLLLTRRPGQSELDWAAEGRRAGIDYAGEHLTRLPLVGTARVLRSWSLWNPIDQAEVEAVESRDREWQVAGAVTTLVVLALAIPGTRRLMAGPASIAPMAAVVVGVTLAALVANGNSRFTLAGQPVLAVAAAAFVSSAWTRRRR
jgi:hypothetical protein